jgi:hypothetical protein
MRCALLVCGYALCTAGTAGADRRMFTSTYEYKTVPQGRTAIELWHTESRRTWDADTPQDMRHILEIEHGLTDRWDAALYTVFSQTASGDPMVAEPFALHEMKLETRYRFADRGEWPVDVLAYGELAKEFGASVYEIEAEAIVARDFDKVTVAGNLIGAIELGKDVPEAELELGFAAGATYEVHPKLNLGVEMFGAFGEDKAAVAVGPAVGVAPSSGLWLAFTAGFGVTDDAAALSGRLIVGIEL